jgi:hypothetical protein
VQAVRVALIEEHLRHLPARASRSARLVRRSCSAGRLLICGMARSTRRILQQPKRSDAATNNSAMRISLKNGANPRLHKHEPSPCRAETATPGRSAQTADANGRRSSRIENRMQNVARWPRFERNTKIVPLNGSCCSTDCTVAARPSAPRRKSTGRVAISTRTPAGGVPDRAGII